MFIISLYMLFLGYIKPYENKIFFSLELFNECIVLLCSYHLFLFTDFVDSKETQLSLGYSLIALTGLLIAVNFIVMIAM